MQDEKKCSEFLWCRQNSIPLCGTQLSILRFILFSFNFQKPTNHEWKYQLPWISKLSNFYLLRWTTRFSFGISYWHKIQQLIHRVLMLIWITKFGQRTRNQAYFSASLGYKLLQKLVRTFRISIENSHIIPQGLMQFKLFSSLSIDLQHAGLL